MSNTDPSAPTSHRRTTWGHTGFIKEVESLEATHPQRSGLESIENDENLQQALDSNLNTFEDLDDQIQKSIASLKKMGTGSKNVNE